MKAWNKSFSLLVLVIEKAEYYYPLSSLGTLTFLISLYLAGYAYSTANLYALLLAVPCLVFITAQCAFIRLWSLRIKNLELLWDSDQNLVSRKPESKINLKLRAPSIPYFFRYHIQSHATLKVGEKAKFYYSLDGISNSEGDVRIEAYFPLCGHFLMEAKIVIRDILGLSRTRMEPKQCRNFTIRPPIIGDENFVIPKNATSMESRQRQKQADEEKYYMREYIPGDRLKDVNWKASLRVGEMITRISPISLEKSQLIYIELRNISNLKNDTPLSLLQLNIAKSWLFSFVVQMRQENPAYHFLITSVNEEYKISNDKDIKKFSLELAELNYVKKRYWTIKNPDISEKFIFTTSFDSSFLDLSKEKSKCYVFQVVNSRNRRAKKITLLPLEYSLPWPGKWLLRFTPSLSYLHLLKKATDKSGHGDLGNGNFIRQMKVRGSVV